MAEGHRKRVRDRFDEENIDTIPDYVVLEMMLQGIISRRTTSEIARELIREFGGLPQVIDAPVEELSKIPGMGEVSSRFIKLIPLFYRRYCLDKWENPTLFNSISKAAEYLHDRFIGYNKEVFMVMCMDAHCNLLACRPLIEGSISAVEINMRKLLQYTMTFNTARVIVGHNHIHGDAVPSTEDIATTEKIYTSLRCIGVQLDDHIIVCGDDYVSLKQSGYMNFEK